LGGNFDGELATPVDALASVEIASDCHGRSGGGGGDGGGFVDFIYSM